MSPSKLLIALLLPAATSYKTSQRLRGAAKQAATPSALKRGAGARLAVNQLDALKDILATANEDETPPRGDISDLLAFSQEAELEQFWLEEAELHEAEDNWAASYDARASELSEGAIFDEDVFEMERKAAAGTKGEPDEDVDDGAAYEDDGAAYEEDYADILVDEAEDRYKDILDYTDYEYAEEYTDADTGLYTDETYFKPISEHVTMQTAVSEVWELGAFLINQTLGPIHSADVNAVGGIIQSWAEDGVISSKIKLQKTRGALKSLIDTIKILEKGIKKRKPASKPRSKFKKNQAPGRGGGGGGMRRAVSAGSLGQLDVSEQNQYAFEKQEGPVHIVSAFLPA